MNIFVLSRHVRTCARMHCDQHVVKMPLESAQLLSTALYAATPDTWRVLHERGLAYKPTHLNHPCAMWTRTCLNNYLWLGALGLELCREYEYRFGDRPHRGELAGELRRHKSGAVIEALRDAMLTAIAGGEQPLPRQRCITPFPLVVPDDCLADSGGDPPRAYRLYYARHKAGFARWTRRERPEWFATSG